MSLSLICDCGARFDADDVSAGQEVPCPECGEKVKAAGTSKPRLSLWAVAALALAIIGGLTPAGGLAAMLVGLVALLVIRRRPESLRGSGVALASVFIGLAGALLTGVLVMRPDVLPVAGWLRQRARASQIDTTGALQVQSRGGEVILTRPSTDWGRARKDRTDDAVLGDLQTSADLLLVNPKRNAYAEVIRDGDKTMTEDDGPPRQVTLANYRDRLRVVMNPYRPKLLGDEDDGMTFRRGGVTTPVTGNFDPVITQSQQAPPLVEGNTGHEWNVTLPRGGQKWAFIVRAYQRTKPGASDPILVIRAYTPAARLAANEEELRRLLDSAQFSP